jgi:serine/threonine protein kinase
MFVIWYPQGHIHLTDFGLSKAFFDHTDSTASGGVDQKTTTMVGTPGYTAPEILLGIPHDRLVQLCV